jgi:quercetin dioxygenase-like cupin family protein
MPQHYYSPKEMEKNLAGKGYSSAEGAWVTGQKIIFGEIHMPAGTHADPHSHPNEQFGYCLRGSSRMVIEGEEWVLRPGDIAYRPPNAVHSSTIGPEEYVFIVAKDTSWGIQGRKASEQPPAEKARKARYFYRTSEMEAALAGEAYSSAKGSWVTGERIIFGKIGMPRGTGADPHTHPNEQFIYLMKGRVRMDIEGDVRECGPGEIIYIPADAVHSNAVVGGEDCEFITAKDTSWGIQGRRV